MAPNTKTDFVRRMCCCSDWWGQRFIFVKSWNFSAFLCPPSTLDRRKIENWPTVVALAAEFRPGQRNGEQFNFLMSFKTESPLISRPTSVETWERWEISVWDLAFSSLPPKFAGFCF